MELARLYAIIGADDSGLTRKLAAADRAIDKFAAAAGRPATLNLDTSKAEHAALSLRDKISNLGDSTRTAAANAGDAIRMKLGNALDTVRSKADGLGDSLRRGLGQGLGIGAGIGAFNLAAQGARMFTDAVGDAVKGAIDEEAGIARMTQALKANVPAWDGNTKAIEAAIKVREALAFSDDELRDSFGRIVAATHDVERAYAVQAVAMDLARFKNIDLVTASEALVRVEGGQFRLLAGLGIQIRDNATQTEALAAVQAVAGGQAVEFGNTTAGAMKAAGVAVDDLAEDIASGLAPAIKEAAIFIRKDLVPALDDARGAFKLFTLGMDLAAEAEANEHRLLNAVSKEAKGLKAAIAEATAVTVEHAGATNAAAMEINDLGLSAQATAYYLGLESEATIAAADAAAAHVGPLSAEAAELDNVAFRANIAAANLAALSSAEYAASQATAQRLRLFGEDPGNVKRYGGVPVVPYTVPGSPPYSPPPKGGGGGGGAGGADDAKRKAEELANALRTKLRAAYEIAKDAALKGFAAIHDKNARAIDDEHKHAYAIAQTTFDLKMKELQARRSALYDKVNADEAALSATEQAQRMRDLGEAAADAQAALTEARAGGDPKAIAAAERSLRDAQEAQSNAQARIAIDAQKAQADTAAKGLDAEEESAKTKLAADQTAADELAAQKTKQENERYDAEVEAYERSYKALLAHLEDNKTLHSKTNTEILDLYEQLQAPYEAAGAKIAKSLIAGLKGELAVTLPGPTLTGKAEDWGKLTQGYAPTGGMNTTTGAGGPQAVSVNLTVALEGAITDSQGALAQKIAEQLISGLNRAWRVNGMTTGRGGAAAIIASPIPDHAHTIPDHTHPLTS